MARFTSKLTLVLGLCAALALANTAKHAAVDDRPQVICNKGHCYPRVFRPTTEFQEILEGQEIPGGLHVQMDFETHRKFAKLMDPETETKDDASNSILVVDTDTPGVFQHSVNGDENIPQAIDVRATDEEELAKVNDFEQLEVSRMNLQTAFDSIADLNQGQDMGESTNTKTAPVPRQTDHQIYTEQLKLARASQDKEVVLNALEELAEIASDMDFGLRLSGGEGLRTLVALLSCEDEASCEAGRLIRSKAAMVIGTAVQNHEKAQESAYKADLHNILLTRLEIETDQQVLRRLIFAYGSLVRSNRSGDFIQDRDIARLAAVFEKSTDANFQRKCIYVMSDFADPDMRQNAPEVQDDHAEQNSSTAAELAKEEQQKQVAAAAATEALLRVNVGPWCETLQKSEMAIQDGDEEDQEMVDHALALLNRQHPETCILTAKSRDEL